MLRSLRKAAETLERNIDNAFSTGSGDDGGYTNREFEIGGIRVKLGPVFATGGFSFVHSARPAGTSASCTTRYAVKRMSCIDPEGEALARREIDLLSSLPPHRNIVRFLGATVNPPAALLMFELLDGGTLHEVLERRHGAQPSPTEILSIFHDAVAAVAHLHSLDPPIACRDVKLENLLYDRLGGAFKLCDFGSCTVVAQKHVTRREILDAEDDIGNNCSMMYRAPEMVDLYSKQFICERVDVWALGCIFFALLYGKLPFDGGSSMPILKAAYEVPPNSPKYPDAFDKLVKAMLNPDPAQRADVFTVLEAVCRLRNFEMDPQLRERGQQLREQRAHDFGTSATNPPRTNVEQTTMPTAVQAPAHDFFAPLPTAAPLKKAPPAPLEPDVDAGDGWADFDSAFNESRPTAEAPTHTPAPVPGPRPVAPIPNYLGARKPTFAATALPKAGSQSAAPTPALPGSSPWGGVPKPGPAPVAVSATSGTLPRGGPQASVPTSVTMLSSETRGNSAGWSSQGAGGKALDLNALYGASGRIGTVKPVAMPGPEAAQPVPAGSGMRSSGQTLDLNALYGASKQVQPTPAPQSSIAATSQPVQGSAYGVRPGGQAMDLQMLYGESSVTPANATAPSPPAGVQATDEKDAFADLSAMMMDFGSMNGKKR